MSGYHLTSRNITSLREGGKILAEIMGKVSERVETGVSTLSIDTFAEHSILESGGVPAFKGYGGRGIKAYPATICASLNDEVVHGIPEERKILQSGDLLKIDIGMKWQGVFVDMARTFCVGSCSETARRLAAVTEESFWAGVKTIRAGSMLSDYARAAQSVIEKAGFSVVKNLVGHGIGLQLHEDPQIPNYWDRHCRDVRLRAGMALAIEPMVNAGGSATVVAPDGWTYKTKDGSLSAHYENTLLVTERGVDVLTTHQ